MDDTSKEYPAKENPNLEANGTSKQFKDSLFQTSKEYAQKEEPNLEVNRTSKQFKDSLF